MALKAEGAALDCFEVTLKCEEDEDEAMVVAVIPRPEPVLSVAPQEKPPLPRAGPPEAADVCEEPKEQMPWEQEFLVGNSPGGSGQALCMVCGAVIWAPSADTARAHILDQHPHTLDLSRAEKSNILEAWSEGVALLQDIRAEQPSSPNPDLGPDSDPDSGLDPTKMPAEIVVLLDSEDNAVLPRRVRPRGLRPLELLAPPAEPPAEPGTRKPRGQRWKEVPVEEPARKKRGRSVSKMLDLNPDPDPDPDQLSPDSPTEAFAAPVEVRHFTDGTFPPGFVLQLFSHTHLRASVSKSQPKEEEGAPAPEPLPRDKPEAGTGEADTAHPQRRYPGASWETGPPGYPSVHGGAICHQPPARLAQAPAWCQGCGSR
ncbi:spindlin interactor and repressor of chromatin-binding protein isoform X2 [Sorex araneus]|uniref:spindlin interactor and repressor of chromatin-binding protein isoform X2 n=1 Tax=Sorex araneus TaxID=42254 RepID=UPI002433F4BC|nr:spindlin interactor and repressor of chromatin-binding protein isoform X2 [Sorex araneus]